MSDSLQEKLTNLAAMDTAALGQLVRAKAIKAVAMHFMLRGVQAQLTQGGGGLAVEEAYRRMKDDLEDFPGQGGAESDTR